MTPSGWSPLTCQTCHERPATHYRTERWHGRPGRRIHYRPDCWAARPRDLPILQESFPFPLPRLTVRQIMILVAAWAVPNAVTAWVMRSGLIPVTPDQLREWTVTASLAVDLILAFYLTWLAAMVYLRRVIWFRQTGRATIPKVPQLPLREQPRMIGRSIPVLIWCLVAIALEKWLTPRLWPIHRDSHRLMVALMWGPLLVVAAARLARGRARRRALGSWLVWEWRAAAPQERVARIAALVGTFGFLLFLIGSGPGPMMWGFVWWFPIPPLMVAWIVVLTGLPVMVALATRRR